LSNLWGDIRFGFRVFSLRGALKWPLSRGSRARVTMSKGSSTWSKLN